MDARQAIKMGLDTSAMVCEAYLADMSDEDLMKRPHSGCNHIKWQVGHLISAEHQMVSGIVPDSMPALPNGFAERYTKETTTSDDPAAFDSKEDLMRVYKEQRSATLAALENLEEGQLDQPGPEAMRDYAPTVAAVFGMQGSHWLMHAGQWVPIRRECGRDIVI